MTNKVTTTPQEKPAGFNVFRNPFLAKSASHAAASRKVIPYDKLNKSESQGVKRLFEALVPNDKSVPIDEKLIWEEALPAFEEFLGEKRFKKLKRFFGIGFNPLCKNIADEKEVRIMVGELRTIENARFYLPGFKDLIDRFADRLEGAPEEMDAITRAKVLRMYLVIFCSYYFFIEDFDFVPAMVEVEKEVDGKIVKVKEEQLQTVINRARAISNGTKTFYPEVMFELERLKFDKCGYTTILYDAIVEEVKRLRMDKQRKNVCKELLRFAELKYADGTFESVNAVPIGQTYSTVRSLKREVHDEPGVIPFEAFSFKALIPDLFFEDFYTMYKVLKKYTVKELDKKELTLEYIEGSRFAKKPYICYTIVGDNEVGGQNEADRIIWFVEYCADKEFELKSFNGKKKVNVGHYMSAIKFATDMGYLVYETSVMHDVEVAELLLDMNDPKCFMQYWRGEITKEELREILCITDALESVYFPHLAKFAVKDEEETAEEIIEETPDAVIDVIETAEEIEDEVAPAADIQVVSVAAEENPYDAIVQFAIENGYVSSEESVSRELIENVVICGNEDKVMKFAAGKIDEATFKKRIGFEEEFAEMYFDLKMVDATSIEAKLLELKRTLAKSDAMMKSALIVRLYCYLVENEVKCGSKNKAVKRNKSLKPANLKSLIEAA